MKISKQVMPAFAAGILVGAILMRLPQSESPPAATSAPEKAVAGRSSRDSPSITKRSDRPDLPAPSSAATPAATDVPAAGGLAGLMARWDELATHNQGEALLEKQHELALQAARLGASDDLLRFLKFLSDKGAGDLRNQIIDELGAEIFSGAHAANARRWLVTLDDPKLREQLCYLAGKDLPTADLKDYIAAFHPDDHSQSAVLVGYCRQLAQTDPEAAVKAFVEQRPPNVTYDGYAEIMAALPPTADFAKLSAALPDDSRSLARKARTALLQNWSLSQPEAAAQYVLANSQLANPEQMAVVVSQWATTSPDSAMKWIRDLSPGAPRDQGTAALARHWMGTDPVQAWEWAENVGDFNKRVETATAVFKEWEKIDPAAATRAWTALFPEG